MRSLWACALAVVALGLSACGNDPAPEAAGAQRGTVVVTTSILGDVVAALVGDEAGVTVVMPAGVDPHDFQASAREAAVMRRADLLVANGAGFEEGLADIVEGAEEDGVPVVEAVDAVEPLGGEEGEHAGEHADEPADEHGHDGTDPHFFTDPRRMAAAAAAVAEAVVEHVEGVDADVVRANLAAYTAELERLDADIEETLRGIPTERRVLVTNHEVFAYFAERYRFEVVGTVVPGGSTAEGVSPGALDALAEAVRRHGVRAIFADTSAPDRLARTLAAEVGGEVAVVELYSESLGARGSDGATYLQMMRTNAARIAAALA